MSRAVVTQRSSRGGATSDGHGLFGLLGDRESLADFEIG